MKLYDTLANMLGGVKNPNVRRLIVSHMWRSLRTHVESIVTDGELA